MRVYLLGEDEGAGPGLGGHGGVVDAVGGDAEELAGGQGPEEGGEGGEAEGSEIAGEARSGADEGVEEGGIAA